MQAGADTRTEIVPGIADAIDRFMAALGNQNLSWETIRKYRGLLKRRLLSWCEEEGYSAVSALTVTRLDDFRQTWQDGPLYATKNLERLRAFFSSVSIATGSRRTRQRPSKLRRWMWCRRCRIPRTR